LKAKKEIEIWGDGQQTRSFLYIDDCLDAVYRLMQSDYSEPINIGTSENVTIDGLAQLVMKIAGKELRIKHLLDKPQGVRGRNADLTLIKQQLGWEPKVRLEDGMRRVYEWIEAEKESQSEEEK
jgi:nucleoside-diphosphate-sugar epimerase